MRKLVRSTYQIKQFLRTRSEPESRSVGAPIVRARVIGGFAVVSCIFCRGEHRHEDSEGFKLAHCDKKRPVSEAPRVYFVRLLRAAS